jgi:hypothetical protein
MIGELQLAFNIIVLVELTYLLISRYIGLKGLGTRLKFPKIRRRIVKISDDSSSSSDD